jgi:hypothetical protein
MITRSFLRTVDPILRRRRLKRVTLDG